MGSGDDRDDYIRQLRAEGYSAIEIGAEVGLSRSQVHRILAVVGDAARGDLDDDEDLTKDELVLLDEADEEDPHVEPFTYVGEGRYLDGNGRSMSKLDFYRWRMYRKYDDDEWELVARVEAHMAAQIAAYEARR